MKNRKAYDDISYKAAYLDQLEIIERQDLKYEILQGQYDDLSALHEKDVVTFMESVNSEGELIARLSGQVYELTKQLEEKNEKAK